MEALCGMGLCIGAKDQNVTLRVPAECIGIGTAADRLRRHLFGPQTGGSLLSVAPHFGTIEPYQFSRMDVG